MSQSGPKPMVAPPAPGRDAGRVAVVAARWNARIVDLLLEGCTSRLAELSATVSTYRVPGAFELPTAASWAAGSGGFDAVICLGCVIRGETPHFELVAGECARGIMRVSLDTGVPVIFGVLTTNALEQALARCGGDHGHAGIAAAEAAVEMILLRGQFGAENAEAHRQSKGEQEGSERRLGSI